MHDESKKAIAAAFLANLGIAIAKLIGFAITGASSMLAESVHSLADTGNQGLLVLGGRQAARAPTEDHPFGFGRNRYFWSFVVALVLFLVGGLFAIYEGVEKLRQPHDITSPAVALGILGVALVLEAFSLRTAVKAANPLRRGRSWVQFIRLSKSPELPVVLLEDLGALVGLAFAFTGITLAVVTGEPRFDGAATCAIGALLVVIAVVLVLETKSLLIGESASAEDRKQIEEQITGAPHVRRLLDMKTLHLGPDELLVAAKVEFDRDLTVPALAAAVDGCEARVRGAIAIPCEIYLEPDLAREQAPPTGPAQP